MAAAFLRHGAAALLLLAAGCGTPGPQDARVAPYMPETERQGAWYDTLHPGGDSGSADQPRRLPPSPAAVAAAEGVTAGPGAPVAERPAGLRALKRGDSIMIYLLGIPDRQQIEDVVDELGNVSLPHVNEINIEGLTTSEAERKIRDLYIKGEIYRDINVTIVSQNDEFFVRGEVKKEGRYRLTGGLTLVQAVSVAGGYTEYAQPKKVQIMRGGKNLRFNMKDIYEGKVPDPLIKRGDVIVVPRRWIF